MLNDVFAARLGDDAIRLSLVIVLGATLWGAVHSLLAARTLERDLDAAAHADQGWPVATASDPPSRGRPA